MTINSKLSLLLGAALLAPASPAAAQQFEPLGNLPGAAINSAAQGVSADGVVVVGVADNASAVKEAFRWTLSDGMVGLGGLPGGVTSAGGLSTASAVSADGAVVVGYGNIPSGSEAFRWTQSGGMVGLGHLPGGGAFSTAQGVSADGAVVVGASDIVASYEAFRWTAGGGMVGLGDLPGGTFWSEARGVSADGAVVVGRSNSLNGYEAFRWTQSDGMVGLGDLAGGAFDSIAFAVSADGAAIVGVSSTASGIEAFRWTGAGGMTGLGYMTGGGAYSIAFGVSADGGVIVGVGDSVSGPQAFRWTEALGMRSIASLLTDDGVDLGDWVLSEALGVSADGTVIVGTGTNEAGAPEAWWAKLGAGLLSAGALSASLQSMVVPPMIAQQTTSADLNAALYAGRQFGCNGLSIDVGALCAWGSLGGRQFSDGENVGDGAIGLGYQATRSLRFGGGVHWSRRDTHLAVFDGSAEGDTFGLNAFAAYEPAAQGLRLYAAAIADHFNTAVTRGYLNGVDPETSSGGQTGWGYGAAFTAGWQLPAFGVVAVMPFVGYEVSTIRLDAYTETSGAFPARFEAITDTLQIARLGAEARAAVNEGATLWASAAWAHRLNDHSPDVSGEVIALGSPFTVSGTSVSASWAEIAVGAQWRINERAQMHVTVGGASDGDTAPSAHASIGGAIQF